MKSGDHAKTLRAHELMKDSRFYKVVTLTFNKLIQIANNNIFFNLS
jgi:hypothetical protein